MNRYASVLLTEDKVALENDLDIFARDILEGLSAEEKYIQAEYHYDANGSKLFDLITELPEYYLTKVETESLKLNKVKIAELLNRETVNLIELGPGDGSKTRDLIEYLIRNDIGFNYCAVDISSAALESLADDYRKRFPDLPLECLVSNYTSGLQWLRDHNNNRNVVLFLGSSIGNFSKSQSQVFLDNLYRDLKHDDLVLIGFDLIKDAELIRKAYNDSQGVTAEFNYNLLRRINRELSADFDLTKFQYTGRYSTIDQVHRSYLVSLIEQDVYVGALKTTFQFREDEAIHTEDSRKYTETDIEFLAGQSGFSVVTHLYDSKRYFVDSVWRVQKS
jgi:dimethylhistidine N-methyltransferase